MKKKWPLLFLVPVLAAVIIGGAVLWMHSSGLSFSTGQFFTSPSGNPMFLWNGTPVELAADSRFASLTDGDEILVLHAGIQESYPARTTVQGYWKIRDGSPEDIPQEILQRLTSLQQGSFDITLPAEDFAPRTAWVNWCEPEKLKAFSCNPESPKMALPVFRFTSPKDIQSFRDSLSLHLTLDSGYDEVPGFDAVMSDRDEAFFEENILLGVYVTSGSGSDRFGAANVVIKGSTLKIQVQQTNAPEIGTCDMAGWLITLAMPRASYEKYMDIQAEFI